MLTANDDKMVVTAHASHRDIAVAFSICLAEINSDVIVHKENKEIDYIIPAFEVAILQKEMFRILLAKLNKLEEYFESLSEQAHLRSLMKQTPDSEVLNKKSLQHRISQVESDLQHQNNKTLEECCCPNCGNALKDAPGKWYCDCGCWRDLINLGWHYPC